MTTSLSKEAIVSIGRDERSPPFGRPPMIAEAAAPAAAARSSAGWMSAPDSRAARKAATKASPAPVVSIASIFGALTRQRFSPAAASQPAAPRLMTTSG